MPTDIDLNVGFDLTSYYHSYVVKHSEHALTQCTGFFYNPLIKKMHRANLEKEKEPTLLQKPCFKDDLPRTVAVAAGVISSLYISLIWGERVLFSFAEIARMTLYSDKRKWKLIQLSFLVLLNELIILPKILFARAIMQMITTLYSPEMGVKRLEEDVKRWNDKWMEEYEKKKRLFESFCNQDLTDQVLRKQTKDKMATARFNLFKNSFIPAIALYTLSRRFKKLSPNPLNKFA